MQKNPSQLNNFKNHLDNFFKRFINTIKSDTGHLPMTKNEPDWLSSCQEGQAFFSEEKGDSIYWQPVLREKEDNNDLLGLEKALEIELRPELKEFFTRYWSEQIDTIFQQGNLTLLFVWNKADMDRLIENQIGHALNKLRNKQSLTFFIACTDSDYMISLEHDTGHIVLERPGYAIEKVLSENLIQFIDALEYGQLSS